MTNDNNEIKQQLNDLLGIPSHSSFGKSAKQKIIEGLKLGKHLVNDLMRDTTSRIVEYRDMFKKEGHNIIENKRKESKE